MYIIWKPQSSQFESHQSEKLTEPCSFCADRLIHQDTSFLSQSKCHSARARQMTGQEGLEIMVFSRTTFAILWDVNRSCILGCPSNYKTKTLQETNISHLGKRKIIFKYALSGGYVTSQEGTSEAASLAFRKGQQLYWRARHPQWRPHPQRSAAYTELLAVSAI